jgi:hypothetical protein
MALPSSSAPFGVPIAILTDSYKASHFAQYPAANKLVAYGEFRRGFEGDKKDTRFVFYGMRHVVETYVPPSPSPYTQPHNIGSTLATPIGLPATKAASLVFYVCVAKPKAGLLPPTNACPLAFFIHMG